MNGYIQIEINGKPVELKFTMWALEEMNRLKELHADSALWNIVAMIYGGYLNSCRRKNVKPELIIQDIDFFVDDCFESDEGKKLLADVTNCFNESDVIKTNVKEATEEEKKTLIGNESMSLYLAKSG